MNTKFLSSSLLFFISFIAFEIAAQTSFIYESENLKIEKLTHSTYRHETYLKTEDYGKVACNGMIVISANEAIVFDTPTNASVSKELIEWIEVQMEAKIKGVVPTHFHRDCLGGLEEFQRKGIPSYAFFKTIKLARDNQMVVPQNQFKKKKKFSVGQLEIECRYFGEGHTSDNILAFVPKEKVLFGGCFIKSIGAGKGYLGDANVEEWSASVEKVKSEYNAEIIIPGHGNHGNKELLDYTIRLFN